MLSPLSSFTSNDELLVPLVEKWFPFFFKGLDSVVLAKRLTVDVRNFMDLFCIYNMLSKINTF